MQISPLSIFFEYICLYAYTDTNNTYTYKHSLDRISGYFNSLVAGTCGFSFKCVIFRCIVVIDIWNVYYEIALRWIPQELIIEFGLHWLR